MLQIEISEKGKNRSCNTCLLSHVKYVHVDSTLEVYSFANLGLTAISLCQPKLSKANRKQTNRDKGISRTHYNSPSMLNMLLKSKSNFF